MKIVTSQDRVLSVSDRFARQYSQKMDMKLANGKTPKDTLKSLKGLINPKPVDIALIVGNYSWTNIMCSKCGSFVQEAVDNDGEFYCKECIRGLGEENDELFVG